MKMEDKTLLTDPSIEPTKAVLAEALGDKYKTYEKLAAEFTKLGYKMEWQYYRDSKAWLCKVVLKKTICWLSIWDSGIKLSFFFTEKSFPKNQKFHNAETPPMWGKMLPVILLVKDDKYFDEIVGLAKIKEVK